MAPWDANRVKAQLRLTAQRLGQLQDKLEAQGQITRRDIATLLQQNNLILARAKAQKLMREDIYSNLLQTLEMHLGIILGHIGEFERSTNLSPVTLEAAASVVYAAPWVDSRDLQIVSDMFMQQLGLDFVRDASNNQSGYVSPRVLQVVSAPPPSASTLDRFLYSVARVYNVQWRPDLLPHERVDAISSMLDPSSIPEIDMQRLRVLCSHGLPEYPPWLRPRVWRLLLCTLPPNKTTWHDNAQKQRDNYYDLLRRLLEPFGSLPPPSQLLAPLDASLVEVSKALTHVPHGLYAKLEEEPDKAEGCPLDETAPEDIRIVCAGYLDARLRVIRESESRNGTPDSEKVPEIRLEGTPEIRLEATPEESQQVSRETRGEDDQGDEHHLEDGSTPEISLSGPDSPRSVISSAPTTLLPSRSYTASGAHPKHASALLRLLYVHSALNPANRSPQVASLLVPLYSALVEEIQPEDTAHIEADTFWLFEAMVGEFSELEEAEGASVWMQKICETLKSADAELAEELQLKGLDPALPHYSYRWLTTLLTHTLPLADIHTIWDAIFSRPMRERNSNPKLDYLVDICTSLLLCARGSLIRLGRPPMGLLNVDENTLLTGEPLSERELEEAFAQGMILLQSYTLREAGGVERVLQLAFDLSKQREAQAIAAAAKPAGTFAERWRNTLWKPLASPVAEAQEEEEEESEDSEDEHVQEIVVPSRSTLGSRLTDTVWKGITNQSAMEPPPSPAYSPSLSPANSPARLPETPDSMSAFEEAQSSSKRGSSLWAYAEKLRDSDTAATLAKVSTNWRVKAMDAWTKRATMSPQSATPPPSASLSPSWVPSSTNRASLEVKASPKLYEPKRSSLPEKMDRSDAYSPPPRPAFFRNPRDSMMPDPRDMVHSPTGSDRSAKSEASFTSMQGRRESLGYDRTASPNSAATSIRSGGPKPLLLNSGSLITNSRSSTTDSHFPDVVRTHSPRPVHRGSVSSLSSMSPSEHTSTGYPNVVGTAASRVVPLNRKSTSPMARARRQESLSSTSSPFGSHRRLPGDTSPESDEHRNYNRSGWRSGDASNATTTGAIASQPPNTPPPGKDTNGSVHVVAGEGQRGSVVLSEFGEMEQTAAVAEATPKLHRKTNPSLSRLKTDDSSDSSAAPQAPTRTSRVRSKRYPPRLANLRTNSRGTVDRIPSQNSLAAPELPDEGDATTPKATNFESMMTSPRRASKMSGEGRTRKVSTDGSGQPRRKVSSERPKQKRDSSAVEGDDEGYDELLSAYESEDSIALH